VNPTDRAHARAIVTSSQPFLDWTSPNVLMDRCETYLAEGPIRDAIASSREHLLQAKKIRNHIAHNSRESQAEFVKIVRAFYLTDPAVIPSAGEFLAHRPTTGVAKKGDVLSFFMDKLSSTAIAIAG
jgi:hypothetical protein